MLKRTLTLVFIAIVSLNSCKKDDDTTPEPSNPQIVVPSTYEFTDADGNNTVNFNGQAQRLEMLEEIASYMKTANTAGISIDAQTLKDMYVNDGITWSDGPELGMTGSSKQLKSKTAAAPSGIADPGIQASFELYIEQIATLSASTIDGENTGSAGVGGVVVSSTNPSKQYLQSAEGVEYSQVIEKGLMGAVFYNQITQNYLSESEMSGDNSTAIDPDNGKYYTDMEHAWDEAYGYFTTATDYAPDGNGTDRFWGKYADGSREELLGSATKISEAFRNGRAAIVAKDLSLRNGQIAIIRTELERMIAGTAIHYLNGAVGDFGDDALRNHQLSEAIAFIGCLPYGFETVATQQEVAACFAILGNNHYDVTITNINSVRDLIATEAGLSEYKEIL
ncbi:MAG: hypothetical protein ACI81Y_001749 [Glaciecola sp.]|jgi:hypothetical protein